ncbi:MAG: class F sortase [Candidatus Saccharibacteria bacterium]
MVKKSQISKFRWVALAFGLTLVAIGGWRLLIIYNSAHKTTKLDNPTQAITTSSDEPTEGPVVVASNYSVPADQPFKIKIPQINAEGYIQKVGDDKFGKIAVPTNINMAGWYINSIKPGKTDGLSIIDGHVHGNYNPGIFINLNKLSVGSEFVITYGDGQAYNFKIKSVQNVKYEDSANVLFTKDPNIASQLNLVTCGGKYNESTKTYDKRVIVISEKI